MTCGIIIYNIPHDGSCHVETATISQGDYEEIYQEYVKPTATNGRGREKLIEAVCDRYEKDRALKTTEGFGPIKCFRCRKKIWKTADLWWNTKLFLCETCYHKWSSPLKIIKETAEGCAKTEGYTKCDMCKRYIPNPAVWYKSQVLELIMCKACYSILSGGLP
jgi:hypothetical protein